MSATTAQSLLVIGAGISGVTSALEAAEAGHEVILVEREPSIGGRVLRNYQYFPKMCPPACGFEINTRRLEKNPRIRVLTNTEVSAASRVGRKWQVTLKKGPRFVNERCTACGDCAAVCPTKVPNPFNLGMEEVPAIRLPFAEAFPKRFSMDRSACTDGCTACVDACKYEAIDLAAQPEEETFEVGAIVVATGWQPYPLENLRELGSDLQDVIANVQMERLAAETGPTQGKILRPSDGKPPRRVAFVQCAGSRDVNHQPYCSSICCLASLKQARYVKEQLPDAEVTMYYIDRRAPGRNEDVLVKAAALEGVRLMKGKVGKVETGDEGRLMLRVEDVESGKLQVEVADLVVLATGMQPSLKKFPLPIVLKLDKDSFVLDDFDNAIFAAGVARRPEDVASSVRDATGASAKAIMAGRRA